MKRKRISKIIQLPWAPAPRGLILDPYAGSRAWWKGLSTRRVIFVDRYFCLPGTVQADVARLPFRDGTFSEVWADPPHWIRKSPLKKTCNFVNATATAWSRHASDRQHGYFGTYKTRDQVTNEWLRAARELARVCKPDAFMVWKSIDGAKTVSQCVTRAELECLEPCWKQVDEFSLPSIVSWSSATTLYTRWQRR